MAAAQLPAPLDVTAMQMAATPPADRRGRPLSGISSPEKKFARVFPSPTFMTHLAELDKRASEQNQGEFLAEVRHCLHCIQDQFATWQADFNNHAGGLETHHRALHSASLAVATIVAATKSTQEEVNKIQASLFTLDRQADVREQKADQALQALSLRTTSMETKLQQLDQHTTSELQGLAQQVQIKVADMEATDTKIKNVVAETVRDTTLGKQVVDQIHQEVTAHLGALQQLKAEVNRIEAHLTTTAPQLDSWKHDQMQLEAEVDRLSKWAAE